MEGTEDKFNLVRFKKAQAYMKDDELKTHLVEISQALLQLECNNPEEIFGWPDKKISVIPENEAKPLLSAEEMESKFPEIEWHKGHSGVLISEKTLEPLILEICRHLFACKESSEAIAFGDINLLWESACRYINDFCPVMRKRIFCESKDRMIYDNFEKGETLDEDLLDISYEEEKLIRDDVDLMNFPQFLVPRA